MARTIALRCSRHTDVALVEDERTNPDSSRRPVLSCPVARCRYFVEYPEDLKLADMGMPRLPLFGDERRAS